MGFSYKKIFSSRKHENWKTRNNSEFPFTDGGDVFLTTDGTDEYGLQPGHYL
jgi:hypothetical protein